MQIHVEAGVRPVDVAVEFQRWMHFTKARLQDLGTAHVGYRSGSRAEIAERLVMKRVTYGQLAGVDLKYLCDKAGVPSSSNNHVMAKRLVVAPYPTADENGAANLEQQRREQRAEQQKQAAAAAPPTTWVECMKRLRARASQQGNKMTKEAFALQLQEWEFMETNGACAVYHIISPLFGGKNHPDNFRVLPAHQPSNYHVSEELALSHHIAMVRLLGATIVKKALEVSLGDKQVAKQKYAELAGREEEFKSLIFPPLQAKPKPGDGASAQPGDGAAAQTDDGAAAQPGDGTATPAGAVPQTPATARGAASSVQGSPDGTEQEAFEAGPNDGAGPSKRPRTESEAPSGVSQEEQEVAMEEEPAA